MLILDECRQTRTYVFLKQCNPPLLALSLAIFWALSLWSKIYNISPPRLINSKGSVFKDIFTVLLAGSVSNENNKISANNTRKLEVSNTILSIAHAHPLWLENIAFYKHLSGFLFFTMRSSVSSSAGSISEPRKPSGLPQLTMYYFENLLKMPFRSATDLTVRICSLPW